MRTAIVTIFFCAKIRGRRAETLDSRPGKQGGRFRLRQWQPDRPTSIVGLPSDGHRCLSGHAGDCAERISNISFQQADALSFQLDTPADAIFSNAVFHWIDADKQETLLRNVSRNLRPGGELVCEFGGYGCGEAVHSTLEELFREHKRTYKKIVFFPTIGQYAPLIEKCGMRVEYAILFDRPTPQKGTIKTGSGCST